jgi:replication initiation protein RepC
MDPHISTTPFGRRPLSLAQVASQATAKACPTGKAVHKWQVFRAICAAKTRVGVSERALAVLDALLTFHPETALTGEALVVFPSNQQLALRAHGMAPATLRRHIAALVDRGLIIRRDSPNGKRYARKGKGGDIEQAFGFDLTPLVARAEEFEAWAEAARAEDMALKRVRERITIRRRDIAKMIATGLEEGVPAPRRGDGAAGADGWGIINALYRGIVGKLSRTSTRAELAGIDEELGLLATEVLMILEDHVKPKNKSGNESQDERHIQNSKPNPPFDLEPAFQGSPNRNPEANPASKRKRHKPFPLRLVLEACPDIVDYGRGGLSDWRDLVAAAGVVRGFLGISPSAWEDARSVLGDEDAAVLVAAILQRGEAIKSPGGYLRELTEKGRAGAFSVGPMLMALLRARVKTGLRA